MVEAGIPDSDVVVVYRDVTPPCGHIVIAVAGGGLSADSSSTGQACRTSRRVTAAELPEQIADDKTEIWGVVRAGRPRLSAIGARR